MRLLFVEDDAEFAEQLSRILKQQYAVDVATDGETAWEWLQLVNYDAVILDVMLPKLNGVQLCQRIRAAGQQVPILLLTGQSTIDDRIVGLDAGADDYLIKPVGFQEVLARLRALLRRSPTITTLLEWGNLQLDPDRHRATFEGRTIALTLKEYLLLKLFLRRGDWVHKHTAILEQLWNLDCDLPSEEAVRAHVKGLRRKLKAVGAGDLIETVYGVGYRLNPAYLAPVRSQQATVLVVAEPQNAELIKQLLEPCGLSIAFSIEPAALLKTLDLTQPDLLILAADAVGLSRLMLCQIVRRDRRWTWLPIVLMMATTDPEVINQGFAAGADDFVHDPVIPTELTNRVLNRLERVRQLQKRLQTG
jgi:DNA-binding response OmpR family regulator